jgi:hypothetical protein
MPVIKVHSNRNKYLLAKNKLWVRDFTTTIKPQDINNLISPNDFTILADNELKNRSLNIPDIGSEKTYFSKIVVVSDGYLFTDKARILEKLPRDVCVIGVNRSLANWKINNNLLKCKMNYYLVNNPYNECIRYMPAHGYLPRCISSIRTNHNFLKKYKGQKYSYVPVTDECFGSTNGLYYQIDDYRNPICASIGLAYRFNVRKLGFFCCDDVFKDERPTAEKLENDLWIYPQHYISHHLIDGNLYWLTHQEDIKVEVVNYSSGPNYENANQVNEEQFIDFFAS